MILQLYKNNQAMIATDGVMCVDGRYTIENIKAQVRERNKSLKKNFPHKLVDSFTIYKGDLRYNNQSKQYCI